MTLARRMVKRDDEATGDRVRHGIALFRARSARELEKRLAVVALALVLEERRALLKRKLLSKDERALFKIASDFAFRHQDGRQRKDYDRVAGMFHMALYTSPRLIGVSARAGTSGWDVDVGS